MIVACVPVPEPQEPPQVEKSPILEPEPTVAPIHFDKEPATRTVKQVGKLGDKVYGLTEDNRVLRIDKTWEFHYDNGKLVEIVGPQNIVFTYEKDRLSVIDTGSLNYSFVYDSRGRLVEVKGGKESLHVDYDSLDQITKVRRGVAGATSFEYDDSGKIKSLARGPVVTQLFYDDKNRVRNFDADDTKFILGYWRDNKIISLTGKTFGPGISVSYGPDYPPFESAIMHFEDDSKLTAAYTDTLYKVTDNYIYCNYVRRLKSILFEGISYAFYVNYFKGDIAGYLAMQFECIPYEA